jgi:hypothetical protein
MEASMIRQRRPAFSVFQLVVLVGIGSVGLAMFFPAIMKARQAAARARRANNMRQVGIAVNNFDAQTGKLPPGVDENNFSALTMLLPYIEQNDLYTKIDFKKSVDDKENLALAKTRIDLFQSPSDPRKQVNDDFPGTNILLCAGSEAALDGNNNVFCRNPKGLTLANIPDGTSNTMMAAETLKGDGSDKATDVNRQIVRLDKDALKNLKYDTGVDDFKNGKHISGMRCANWMDGRFLQGTFNTTRLPNDERPDVDCGGEGGLMSVRSLDGYITIGYFDGSVRTIDAKKIDPKVWKALGNASSNEAKDIQDK